VIKQSIRQKLRDVSRELKQPGDEPYKQVIIRELNTIFGKKSILRHVIKEQILKKFGPEALSPEEQRPECSLLKVLEHGSRYILVRM
jgi:hypothetical protein